MGVGVSVKVEVWLGVRVKILDLMGFKVRLRVEVGWC